MNHIDIIEEIISDASPDVFQEHLNEMFQSWVINAEDTSREQRSDIVFTYNALNKHLDSIRKFCTKKG